MSRTANSTRVPFTARAATSTEPRSVNFSALVVRLSRTRDSARSWPCRRSIAGAWKRSSKPFSSASGLTTSRTALKTSRIEKGAASRSTRRWPPRASSSTLLAVAHKDSAALRISSSCRRCTSLTEPVCPSWSVSARKMIDVSGERRSCAISTTSSSPSGPPNQLATSRGSKGGELRCAFTGASAFMLRPGERRQELARPHAPPPRRRWGCGAARAAP